MIPPRCPTCLLARAMTLLFTSIPQTTLPAATNTLAGDGPGGQGLIGNKAHDTIIGNETGNTIVAGTGNNILTGGGEDNKFVISSGTDEITDFGTQDTIEIDNPNAVV